MEGREGRRGMERFSSRGMPLSGGKKQCVYSYCSAVTPTQFGAVDLLPKHLLKQLDGTDGTDCQQVEGGSC